MEELLRSTSVELDRLRLIASYLSASLKKLVSPAADQEEFVAALLETYESIALPRGQFGRVAVTLDSEDEAELCDAIDERFACIVDSNLAASSWRSNALALTKQLEQLVHFNSERLQSVLLHLANGSYASPAKTATCWKSRTLNDHRAAA